MTVIMATVGYTAAKVHPVIHVEDAKEELVLFYDKTTPENKGRSKATAQELQAYAQKLDVPVKLVEVSAFDLVACCMQVREEVRKRAGKEIVVSIAGGTRVLSSAALLAGILEGVRVVHISEKDNAVQPLPMLRLDAGALLNEEKRRVLRWVREHPGCKQADLVQALGLTKGTVSHHVLGLAEQGLVEQKLDPQDSRSKRLHAVASADLLLME
jgi:CRISPR locus-related DNA-binding protein